MTNLNMMKAKNAPKNESDFLVSSKNLINCKKEKPWYTQKKRLRF